MQDCFTLTWQYFSKFGKELRVRLTLNLFYLVFQSLRRILKIYSHSMDVGPLKAICIRWWNDFKIGSMAQLIKAWSVYTTSAECYYSNYFFKWFISAGGKLSTHNSRRFKFVNLGMLYFEVLFWVETGIIIDREFLDRESEMWINWIYLWFFLSINVFSDHSINKVLFWN